MLAAAPTGAEVDDKDGWGFDMLESSAQPPGDEARQAISALAEAREQLGEQERRSTEAAEEVSRLTEEGSWSLDALAEARRRLADEEQRFSEADTERVRLRVALKQAEAKARARAGNGDPGAG